MKTRILPALFSLLLSVAAVRAQGTAFTYQGRLNAGANPANGSYDLKFSLYDTNQPAGVLIAGPATNTATAVSNGLFAVVLDFGNVFPGADRWLEIGVRSNGSGAFTTLAGRQRLTAAPYAITASNLSGTLPTAQLSGALPSAQLAGTYGSAVTLNNAGNSFTGNGTGLTNVNAAVLGGLSSSNFWRTGGNAGANPANGAFLGTTDNLPLELKVNGKRALRLEPTANNDTVNIAGGSPFNSMSPGVRGGIIAGGGATNTIVFDVGGIQGYLNNATNHVGADFSVVGGGALNRIETYSQGTTNSQGSTIGGGYNNTIQTDAALATIGGGFANVVRTNAKSSVIGGGIGNAVGGRFSTVPGGRENSALGYASFAAGYGAQATNDGTFVWADSPAGISSVFFPSTSSNQFLIRATGGVGINTNDPAGAALRVAGRLVATTAGIGTTSPAKALLVGDETVVGSQGMIRLGSRTTSANDVKRSWDIGVPQTGDVTSGQGYSFVIVDADNVGANAPFIVRYDNHYVGIGTNNPQQALHVVGNIMATGTVTANGVLLTSDRNAKENFTALDGKAVLAKVAALPVTKWNYKTDSSGAQHIGPMAQDFQAAFQLSADDTHISMVDADGVALAAIQGLNEKVESGKQKAEIQIQELKAENAELKERLEKLERLMDQNNRSAR